MTTQTKIFKHDVLDSTESSEKAASILQENLTTLIDLALVLKQAHWNVVGPNFRSVHIQLDEIIETVRGGTDEIAERVVTIGHTPDGRAATVTEESTLESFPSGFHQVADTISAIAERMKTAIDQIRSGFDALGETDPVSEDLMISISAALEKHLWMMQAQEVSH